MKVLLIHPDKIKLPQSIITFNADSLLSSLLILYSIKFAYDETGTFEYPKEQYKKVTKPYQKWGDKIPIFQLHGTISPFVSDAVKDSRENLIFLESSYNQVSGSMHTWAQSTFLYLAQNNKLIFLGLSMSDPNIRKWLGWTASNITKELNRDYSSDLQLQHLWIKTEHNDHECQTFLDSSIYHLSVKIALINSWSSIYNRLKFILEK